MFKRVLFCIPPFPNKYGAPTHPHTGVGYLSAMLDKYGIENDVIDMRLGYQFHDVHRKIKEFKPDLIGVTMMTYHHSLAYELVAQIKALGHKVIVGGPHVSSLRKVVLEECGADFAVKMEGEYPLLELCTIEDPKSIAGLIYRDEGEIIENSDQPPITELDKIPFPRYFKLSLSQYARKIIPIITSRGCPYRCTFCPIKVVMGRSYRFRSPDNVVDEIKYWYQRGYREFDVQDDNFTVRKERVHKICDLLERNSVRDLQIQCGNGIRANLVDRHLLERMYEVGFRSLAFGVESATPEVLKRVKKGENLDEIERAIEMACDIGYDVALFFIVGLPGETLQTIENSIKLACKYPISIASFYNLVPFPATELYEWAIENHYFVIEPQQYLNHIAHGESIPVIETPEFSVEERRKALAITQRVTQYIRRRDMERKLGNIPLAKMLGFLVYSSFINRVLFYLIQKSPTFKKIVNSLFQKLNIRVYI